MGYTYETFAFYIRYDTIPSYKLVRNLVACSREEEMIDGIFPIYSF